MDRKDIDDLVNEKIAQLLTKPLGDEEIRCIVCGKIHMRKDTHLWVYHVSRGVVCRNHHGVMEWYNNLLEKAD